MVQKNFFKEFRIDLGSVVLLPIFSVLKESKNNEVFLDFEESMIVLFPKSFSGYFCFGLTPRNNIIFWQELLSLQVCLKILKKKIFLAVIA